MSAHPKTLEQIDDSAVRVLWDDGHESVFGIRALRLECPCASCKDEWSGESLIDPAKIPQDLSLRGAQTVGNYAFCFAFSDNHGTGIYSFEKLRGFCPCAACRP